VEIRARDVAVVRRLVNPSKQWSIYGSTRWRYVQPVDMAWDHGQQEEAAVEHAVPLSAAQHHHRQRREDDVDACYHDAVGEATHGAVCSVGLLLLLLFSKSALSFFRPWLGGRLCGPSRTGQKRDKEADKRS
jgi:hypothetical protein